MNCRTPIKVAIADDHDIFKQGIEMVLGYFPDVELMLKASNGKDLLEQIKVDQPDVVLLDLRMPVMNGLEALKELKRLYHVIKVIILSMDADSSDVQEALMMGADGYLLKSSEPQVIAQTILACCKPEAFNEQNANSRN